MYYLKEFIRMHEKSQTSYWCFMIVCFIPKHPQVRSRHHHQPWECLLHEKALEMSADCPGCCASHAKQPQVQRMGPSPCYKMDPRIHKMCCPTDSPLRSKDLQEKFLVHLEVMLQSGIQRWVFQNVKCPLLVKVLPLSK
jgi:hypothetical protein